MKFISKRLFLFLALTLSVYLVFASNVNISRLTCESVHQPLCIGVSNPLLAWQCISSTKNEKQIAYQIIVSDNQKDIAANKGNIWNSGVVKSENQNNIPYKGKKLCSDTRYYWKVRIWNTNKEVSEWSDITCFETGLLNAKDWKGQWIGDGTDVPSDEEEAYKDAPAPIFRKTYQVDKQVASAKLYITGLGYYEATINGKKVTETVLNPGWTDYRHSILYNGYDVTKLLQNGTNVINVMIGNGFYYVTPTRIFAHIWANLPIGRPKMLAQLRIKYADGSQEIIVSDTSWKMAQGPILFNSVYLGERYDARKELVGIDSPLFDDSAWKNVQLATSPGGRLMPNMLPPVVKDKVLKPVRMTEAHPGVFVYDMGQNFSGTIRLKVKGPRGTVIRLRYGEDVYSDGSLNGMTSVAGQVKTVWGANREAEGLPQTCYQQDTYILKGEGEEIYEPRFTWHGFQYVEIIGYPGRPDMNTIEGIQLHADLERVGSFECSNELLNKIATAIDWTFLSNVFSVQSDCPHRERLGYGGDLAATLDSYIYKFNMNNFYQNTVRNMNEARRPNGLFTEASPFPGFGDHGFGQGSGPLGWQFGFCLTMNKLYEYYGNKRIIEQNYDAFKAQVDTLHKMRPTNLMTENDCLGDHEALTYGNMDNTTFDIRCIPVSATAHYYEHVRLLAKFAKLLNRPTDYQMYSKLGEDIKAAFINAFVKDDGTVGNGSQSAMCFAMFYQLYPKEMEQKIFNKFIESISRAGNHIHTGFFGTEMILQILSTYGRKDLAYKLATNTTFPSWGHMIQNGATTIWETWRYSDNVYSHNHPMFGTISEWYYRYLLGINSMEPGFRKFIVRPVIPDGLTYAKGFYNSILGKIEVDWRKIGTQFIMKVTVPFGSEADIYVPDTKQNNGYEIHHVGSGNYEYTIND